MKCDKHYIVVLAILLTNPLWGGDLDEIISMPDSLVDQKIELLDQFIVDHAWDTAGVAEAKLILGQEYARVGFTDKALDELNQSYELYLALNDSSGISAALIQISNTYAAIQKYHESLTYVLLSKPYTTDINLLKDINHRIGYVYFNLDAYDSARKYFELSVEQFEKVGEVPVASLLMLGGIHINEQKYAQALQDILKVESLGIEGGSYASQYYTYNFISALYKRLGNMIKSEEYLRKRDSLGITPDMVDRELDFLETNVLADTIARNYVDALDNQSKYITQLRAYYQNNLTTQLANYQKIFELKEKEAAIEMLEKENELFALQQSENRFYLTTLILGVAALTLMIILAYRLLIVRTRVNVELQELNDQIMEQQGDLQKKNELLEQTIEELKGTQHQLIQSEKMASIGSFVSGVAHELNNPINILNGGLQVIERNLREMEPDQDARHSELMDDINVMLRESSFSITRINKIIQALVIATYTDKLPVMVDFTEIIDNVKLAFREMKHSDIKFIQEVESVEFECFPNRIHHAIKAVLENAYYYAGLSPSDEKFVRISVRELPTQLELVVENSGPPIPKQDLLKIFDPFYTTKDDGESPGLGLYFAFSAVSEHHGTILASNRKGSVAFIIHFPKSQG